MVLLAPSLDAVPGVFARGRVDPHEHARLLARAQRLRGDIYLEDDAISASALTRDGRHVQTSDPSSWHLLMLDGSEVHGCMRYRDCGYRSGFHTLGVSASPLAACHVWGARLRRGVEQLIRQASARELMWVEAGGWALSPLLRCTTRGLGIVFATWGLGRLTGGCLGITTATRRHSSASILRRIGGMPLAWEGSTFPRYFDPMYGCEMEILSFDSSIADRKYAKRIEQWTDYLAGVPVVCATGEALAHSTEYHVHEEPCALAMAAAR
jgi:hypothetical protein